MLEGSLSGGAFPNAAMVRTHQDLLNCIVSVILKVISNNKISTRHWYLLLSFYGQPYIQYGIAWYCFFVSWFVNLMVFKTWSF